MLLTVSAKTAGRLWSMERSEGQAHCWLPTNRSDRSPHSPSDMTPSLCPAFFNLSVFSNSAFLHSYWKSCKYQERVYLQSMLFLWKIWFPKKLRIITILSVDKYYSKVWQLKSYVLCALRVFVNLLLEVVWNQILFIIRSNLE